MTKAEQYLDSIPMWATKKNGLAAIRDFLEELGNPDESMNIIHVAGTNGKGSVCSYLSSILAAAGYKTAVFISPHLVNVRERFLIHGIPVSEKEFEQVFEEVKHLSDLMVSRGYEPPTYFEFLFYMFMVIGRKTNPDFVILETGLGGLLDTTNVVRSPLLTVITSISLDHMQYLGNTVKKIASQKAGIIKNGVPVVYDATCFKSSEVIEERANQLHCLTYPVSDKSYKLIARDRKNLKIAVFLDNQELEVSIPSTADYQIINGTLAIYAAKALKNLGHAHISFDNIVVGIEKSYWPGRMEEVLPEVWLDGAHNRGGMEALTQTIRHMQQETSKLVSLMFGVVSDKEYNKMIENLCSHVAIGHVVIAHMDTDRSAEIKELVKEFKDKLRCPVEAFDTVSEAWNYFLETKGENLGFCVGSLYLVGEVKALLARENG